IYELLGGKRPFPTYRGESESVLARMVADRMKPAPSLRKLNPKVSPAVESIVARCLDPDQARRYQNAADLHEDLERHLKNLPLKHAPEPSLRERLQKWGRRHPRLASTSSATLAAALIIVMLGFGMAALREQLARHEATENLSSFRSAVKRAEVA